MCRRIAQSMTRVNSDYEVRQARSEGAMGVPKTCAVCGQPGHNKRTCPQVVGPQVRKDVLIHAVNIQQCMSSHCIRVQCSGLYCSVAPHKKQHVVAAASCAHMYAGPHEEGKRAACKAGERASLQGRYLVCQQRPVAGSGLGWKEGKGAPSHVIAQDPYTVVIIWLYAVLAPASSAVKLRNPLGGVGAPRMIGEEGLLVRMHAGACRFRPWATLMIQLRPPERMTWQCWIGAVTRR